MHRKTLSLTTVKARALRITRSPSFHPLGRTSKSKCLGIEGDEGNAAVVAEEEEAEEDEDAKEEALEELNTEEAVAVGSRDNIRNPAANVDEDDAADEEDEEEE